MHSTASTTDGWRGQPGPDWSELDLLTAVDHAAATGALGSQVLVGYDGRAGSHDLAALAATLLTRRGLHIHRADQIAPTPALGRFVRDHQHLDSAVIATASHNPPGFIGIKLRDHEGLGAQWATPTSRTPINPDTLAGPTTRDRCDTPVTAYYARTVGEPLSAAAHQFDGTIVVDAAHGAVGALCPHLPGIGWTRATPLPFFAGTTPDPTLPATAAAAATAVLHAATDPHRALVALVDGDGDRLVLYTSASGCIGSAEQTAILIAAGLPVERLITTLVAPRMLLQTAHQQQPAIPVTQTPIGFKNIVEAWRHDQHRRTLAMEPNGALVWTHPGNTYCERDSLAALTTILTTFPSTAHIDHAIANLRTAYPNPQQILTITTPLNTVLNRLGQALPGWKIDAVTPEVTAFAGGPDGHITVRASGTETATRLYVEAPTELKRRLTRTLST